MKIGIIGCGSISKAYLTNVAQFPSLSVGGIADIRMEAAVARAEEFGLKAMTVDELLANKEIIAVVNLTIPDVHASVSESILRAGKHAYSEKPLATVFEDGSKLMQTAEQLGLRVGCAPDTFLGAGQQTARHYLDKGVIGRPLAGTVHMLSSGPESWHPNPGFLFAPGGGPLLDIGPYYITTLINLLGPIESVFGSASKGYEERVCGHESIKGKKIPVGVPTHYAGVLTFHSGAVITITLSFDVKGSQGHPPIELYGTEGSMIVPDPNTFGGEVKVKHPGVADWEVLPYSHGYSENTRIIGLVDLLDGVATKRPSRCDGNLALHALEVMLAFFQSHDEGRRIDIVSKPDRPNALPQQQVFQ